MVDKVRAALRDASFWKNPGRAGKYHIVDDDWPDVSMCGNIILDLEAIKEAKDVPIHMRCKKYGCVDRWPD